MRFFRGIRTMEEAHARYRELVFLLHPDHNPALDATAQFQAMQEEYRDLPVLLKYLPYLNEPQTLYIPVPVHAHADFWNVVKTVAQNIPPESYAEGIRAVARIFKEVTNSTDQANQNI